MIPNARTLLERRELLGQLGIHFQLADFPQRLVWADAADGERDLSRRKLRRKGKQSPGLVYFNRGAHVRGIEGIFRGESLRLRSPLLRWPILQGFDFHQPVFISLDLDLCLFRLMAKNLRFRDHPATALFLVAEDERSFRRLIKAKDLHSA